MVMVGISSVLMETSIACRLGAQPDYRWRSVFFSSSTSAKSRGLSEGLFATDQNTLNRILSNAAINSFISWVKSISAKRGTANGSILARTVSGSG